MPLPANFTDELRARTPLPAVVGRRVRLARSGKQWKGCCPFHGEKSPSFYVYEDHYHCFGCGAHGDAISFVMQSQGVAFMDAVGQLAAEAGLEVPQPSPEAAEAERRRIGLTDVLQAAQVHYQRCLDLPEGLSARAYLNSRGLTEQTIARFGLGWAGNRGALTTELARQGIGVGQLLEAGLLRVDEQSGRTFELFSQRIMFPIRDRRGLIISFGGRLLGSSQPKYVNGPETQVFSKRRNLFGLDLARVGMADGGTLIVMEGYMDVIAAAQAGFTAAVAPLGTALSSEQLEEAWRISPCPIVCFDGDQAGARAASRIMEIALPILTPERSLKFATLPEGEDPDTLIRKSGAAALQAVMDVARSASDALYDMVRDEVGDTTPEKRAALHSRLKEASDRIIDKSLRWEYWNAIRARFEAARPSGAVRGARSDRWSGDMPPRSRNRAGPAIPRGHLHETGTAPERTLILISILLRHPGLLHDVRDAFASLAMAGRLDQLRKAILAWEETAESLESGALMDHLTNSGFDADVKHVLAGGIVALPERAAHDVMPAEAEKSWWHFFGFLNIEQLREEVALAAIENARNMTAENQQRLIALKMALARSSSGELDDAALD